jgi:hypothetical protein
MSAGLVDLGDWRLFRDTERLHALGPRVLYELLVEIGAARGCRSEVDAIVSRYLSTLYPQEARR